MGENGYYDFTPDYQRDIVHCMLDSSFLKRHREALRHECFSDPALSQIAYEVLKYFDRRGRAPSYGTVQEYVRKSLKGTGHITAALQELRRVKDVENADLEDVGNNIRLFAAISTTKRLLPSLDTAKNLDAWQEELNTALNLRHPPPALEPYGKDIYSRFKKYKEGYVKDNPVPTGIKRLDTALLGGPGKGELAIVMGITGMGKSQLMVHMAASAVEEGYTVHYYTLEMSARELKGRLDRRFTQKYEKDIARAYKKLAKEFEKVPLYISAHSEGSLTVSELRSYLERTGSPDLLIVDYPALMKKSGITDLSLNRFAVEENYSGVRSIAQDLGFAVWAPFQANRKAHETMSSDGSSITKENSAEAYGVTRHCDILVSWNQTHVEVERGVGRLWIDKNRGGRDKFDVTVKCDWSRSTVR